MSEVISVLIDAFFIYLTIGVVFTIWFLLKGAVELDEGVEHTPWHFKLLLVPGSILLWVILVYKLTTKKKWIGN